MDRWRDEVYRHQPGAAADHRGGGHKRLYRLIDFKRDKKKIPAKVEAIEYDPNRSARIALLRYADGSFETTYMSTLGVDFKFFNQRLNNF